MCGLAVAALACGSLVLAPAAALAMPPAAKQYLPVVPTAKGPTAVHGSAPVVRPKVLTPAARSALEGKSGAELRKVATATALGAPARIDHKDPAQVRDDRPGFLSATFDALGQGAVLALLAGFALIVGLLAYIAWSRRRVGSGTPSA
jgi:hypothetical protein